MAKIPIILEPGRADGKLIKTNSVYDDNQEKFLSDKIKEIDDNHNTLIDTVNNNEIDIENKLETEKNRATNAENNLRETINNITNINEQATTAELVTINTLPNSTVSNVQQALNELFKNATFAGIATPTTNPGTPDVPVFYIATQAGIYTNFDNIYVSEEESVILKWDSGSWSKNICGFVTQETITNTNSKISKVESNLISIENVIQDIDGAGLFVSDDKGNVIATITEQGIKTIDVTIKNGNKLSEIPNDVLEEFYKNDLYISDADGNVILHIDENGHLHYLDDDIFTFNDWKGKTIATYGDSVTAVNNGDFSYPYNFTEDNVKYRWGNRVAQYFRMSNHYGRGIGGTRYMWNGHGGSLCLIETATGIAKNRYDNYTYDDYLADNTIITIPSGQTAIRGCGCSWLRITSMFPKSIKDNIDVVTIMFHNDGADNVDASFIEGSTVDLEWSQSDYYTDYGGDYNIETFRGAIVSLIMKMQAWMPNAVLVLMSPISGQGTANRFKAYFNVLPQVSVGDVYSPNNTPIRMTVTAITNTENEKSITFATFEYAYELPIGATSLIKKSGASNSASTLNFTSLSDKNSDGTLIDINLQLPDGIYNQIDIVDTISQKLSIPFINIFHNCGINGFNKRLYIADTIHPYSENGSKMIARAIIGGLKNILPNF